MVQEWRNGHNGIWGAPNMPDFGAIYKIMWKIFSVILVLVLSARFGVAYAVDTCTGTDFYDAKLEACTPCPNGYDYNDDDGKTDVSQCQIQCAAGTYIRDAGVYGYIRLEYLESNGDAYINTGFKHNPAAGTIRGEIRVGASHDMPSNKNINILGNQTGSAGYSVGWAENQFKVWVETTHARLRGPDHPLVQDGVYDISYEFKNGEQYLTDGEETVHMPHGGGLAPDKPIYLFDNGIQEMDYNFVGRIYWVRIYEDDVLVANFLPVREIGSDDVGIYDTVSGKFFVDSGNGNGFISGNDLSASCVDVGAGYYVGGSVTNFGSEGEREACNPGTYSNNPRATSIATCQPCPGATYNDVEGAAACTPCPEGYTQDTTTTGNTQKSDCKTVCPAGTYMAANMIDGHTKLEYIETTGKQWVNTGIIAANLVNPIMEFTVQYTKVENGKQTGAKKNNLDFKVGISNGGIFLCQAGGANTETKFGSADTAKHTFILDTVAGTCSLDDDTRTLAVGNLTNGPISIGTVNSQSGNAGKQRIYSYRLISNGQTLLDMVPVRNSNNVAGLYDKIGHRFYPSNGAEPFVEGSLFTSSSGCIDVEPGYWSPETYLGYGETIERNQCPIGTTTVGYGHGADEAADCGQKLNIAGTYIYSKSSKPTTPSLNIMMDSGTTFYIGASSTNHTLSKLHLSDGATQYTIYDDSLLFGERDFTTGERITQ